jgi:hypothetical protein
VSPRGGGLPAPAAASAQAAATVPACARILPTDSSVQVAKNPPTTSRTSSSDSARYLGEPFSDTDWGNWSVRTWKPLRDKLRVTEPLTACATRTLRCGYVRVPRSRSWPRSSATART